MLLGRSVCLRSKARILHKPVPLHCYSRSSNHVIRNFHAPPAKENNETHKFPDKPTAEQAADFKPPTDRTAGGFTALIALGLVISAAVGGYSYANVRSNSRAIKNVAQKGEFAEQGGVYPALSLEEASRKMRREEFVGSVGGIAFHRNQVPSNCPVEDYYVEGVIEGSEGGAAAKQYPTWGVFDGHAGSATAATLRTQLLPWIQRSFATLSEATLSETTSEPNAGPTSSASVVAALKSAFTALDNCFLSASLASLTPEAKAAPNALAKALQAQSTMYAGSCALLCLYDPTASNLYAACVGDSRAVLIRPSSQPDGTKTYTVIPLSEDQTGFNESEAARIHAAHPGEDRVIDEKSGRVLGIAISRAFGDGLWKWSPEAIKDMENNSFGRPSRPHYKTPPYLTAEPEVTITRVQQGDVLVMASDGLWDHMSSDAAGECMGRWLEKYRSSSKEQTAASEKGEAEAENKPYDKHEPVAWRVKPEFMTTEDANAATNLIRNTLGGNRRDLFTGVMSTKPTISRYARDDVTVQVVFF